MKISDIYKRLLNGEKFKGVRDINPERLPVKNPADLVGSSPIMQKMAKKHSKNLKLNNKKYPL
ncbi:hypothetical protein [Psychrobacillus sp.]|uniref:hypothetical protein n=1 Tax=Psychrobacillus sp. TaxID=1871623 RepID=UPI0028BDDE8C|nr:hypothetical protein [Psychrobacillus sp.]